MSREKEYLIDILEAARLALSYVSGKTKDEFLKDTQCQDAVIRRLEIIGEAARRISDETRATHPKLPWKAMVGMRNIMIHKYDDVDLLIVWDTVQNDLSPLVAALEGVVPSQEEV
jgi:uncharacterized protein with HEPN domain